jgi:hypothetical protein
MIQYWHATHSRPPLWLRGAPHLSHRKMREGFTYGIGEGWYLGMPPAHAAELAEGWRCWMNDDGPEAEALYRPLPWLRCTTAADKADRVWAAPIVLLPSGKRAFRVSYGKDWQVDLSDGQKQLINFAEEATNFLREFREDQELIDPAPGCAWAARFLEECNFITSYVIQKLSLMDDILMLSTLQAATGATLEAHAEG